jgi:hypothetical protein
MRCTVGCWWCACAAAQQLLLFIATTVYNPQLQQLIAMLQGLDAFRTAAVESSRTPATVLCVAANSVMPTQFFVKGFEHCTAASSNRPACCCEMPTFARQQIKHAEEGAGISTASQN